MPHAVFSPDVCACRESRAHCIDIETAYMQGCQRLDQAVMVGRAGGCGGGMGVQCCPLHCSHPATPGRL